MGSFSRRSFVSERFARARGGQQCDAKGPLTPSARPSCDAAASHEPVAKEILRNAGENGEIL
jgi:hypothetical protein